MLRPSTLRVYEAFLLNETADVAVVLDAVIVGNRRHEWVAGVEDFVVSHHEAAPVQRIGSRRGENLDPPVPMRSYSAEKGSG